MFMQQQEMFMCRYVHGHKYIIYKNIQDIQIKVVIYKMKQYIGT